LNGTDPVEILVVEDHVGIKEFLRAALSGKGYAPIVVSGPPDALPYIDRDTVRLAIIDIVTPKGSGLDLLQRIRDRRPALPCFIVSGHLTPERIDRARRLGAAEILSKPLQLFELEAKIEAVLDGSSPDV